MEEYFWIFSIGLGIGLPFAAIFLILRTVNWNERKNLFFDCWTVYLGWMFSCVSGFLVYDILDRLLLFSISINSDKNSILIMKNESLYLIRDIINNNSSALLLILIFIIQICAVAAILYWRSHPKKEISFVPQLQIRVVTPSLLSISKTAFLVSFLTFAVMWGFIATLEGLDNKLNPPSNNGITYGLYD